MGELVTTGATRIDIATFTAEPAWRQYVDTHPEATHAHLWQWKTIFEDTCRHRVFYLMAMRNAQVCGVLPLVQQKSMLFGKFLTSMPFLNSGGILADDAEAESALLQKAIQMTMELGARYLQLRQRGEYSLPLTALTHKVSPVKRICSDTELMFQELDRTVRRSIRKALSCGLSAALEGHDALADFHKIYTANMRRLGSPSYGLKLFQDLCRAHGHAIKIVIVRHEGKAVAAQVLLHYRKTMEAMWSSSLEEYVSMRPNVLLYWENICVAARHGCEYLDLGRSTRDSGTHRFKQQWGTQDVQLYWGQWPIPQGDVAELSPANPKYRAVIGVWKRLPLTVTRAVGPFIAERLP